MMGSSLLNQSSFWVQGAKGSMNLMKKKMLQERILLQRMQLQQDLKKTHILEYKIKKQYKANPISSRSLSDLHKQMRLSKEFGHSKILSPEETPRIFKRQFDLEKDLLTASNLEVTRQLIGVPGTGTVLAEDSQASIKLQDKEKKQLIIQGYQQIHKKLIDMDYGVYIKDNEDVNFHKSQNQSVIYAKGGLHDKIKKQMRRQKLLEQQKKQHVKEFDLNNQLKEQNLKARTSQQTASSFPDRKPPARERRDDEGFQNFAKLYKILNIDQVINYYDFFKDGSGNVNLAQYKGAQSQNKNQFIGRQFFDFSRKVSSQLMAKHPARPRAMYRSATPIQARR